MEKRGFLFSFLILFLLPFPGRLMDLLYRKMRLMRIYHFNLTSDKRPEKVLPFLISLLSKIFISFSHLLDFILGRSWRNERKASKQRSKSRTTLTFLGCCCCLFSSYTIGSSVMQRRKIIEKVQKVNIFSLFSDVVLS